MTSALQIGWKNNPIQFDQGFQPHVSNNFRLSSARKNPNELRELLFKTVQDCLQKGYLPEKTSQVLTVRLNDALKAQGEGKSLLGVNDVREGVVEPIYEFLFQRSNVNPQGIDETGLRLIAQFEGFKPKTYLCPARKPTIGYGHLLKPGEAEKFKDGISEKEAFDLFNQDIVWAEDAVRELVTVPLTQNQFNALVSFVFNVGAGQKGFKGSTLLKELNQGHYDVAQQEFLKWNRGDGKILSGLMNRRRHESELFGK